MSNSPAEARIEQLEQIEEDVINILKTSGNTLLEVAKDRPSQKAVDSLVQQVSIVVSRHFTMLREPLKIIKLRKKFPRYRVKKKINFRSRKLKTKDLIF